MAPLFHRFPRRPPDCPIAPEQCEEPYADAKARMIYEHLWRRGVRDPGVLHAMLRVPRERFVPPDLSDEAYEDRALPLAAGQTISQPYIVARMSELARVGPGSLVLEIGAGSGYQTAVLLELGAQVWGIEIVAELADLARDRLIQLGYDRFEILHADGRAGLPDKAPFDAILLAAAPESVPPALPRQLKPGGRLVAPVGPPDQQRLVRLTAGPQGVRTENLFPVRFVPLIGG